MKKGQSNRLTAQQKEGQGPITIFHKDAQIHDQEVGNTSIFVKKQLEHEFPMLKFRYRKDLSKKEINKALQKVDNYLGQTLFVESASIRPDGGLIEVQDDKVISKNRNAEYEKIIDILKKHMKMYRT